RVLMVQSNRDAIAHEAQNADWQGRLGGKPGVDNIARRVFSDCCNDLNICPQRWLRRRKIVTWY
ncbi:MAG: hypothetical protein KDA85_11560, partial [Planctomycetaceae bacterium]|nr:hypothetical protein [Planctomycetaceae bacterium]